MLPEHSNLLHAAQKFAFKPATLEGARNHGTGRIGLDPLPEAVAEAAAFSAFGSLREKEAQAYFPTNILTPAKSGDPESFKVRRGKVGGYRDYLTEDDIAAIDAMEREMGNGFASAEPAEVSGQSSP